MADNTRSAQQVSDDLKRANNLSQLTMAVNKLVQQRQVSDQRHQELLDGFRQVKSLLLQVAPRKADETAGSSLTKPQPVVMGTSVLLCDGSDSVISGAKSTETETETDIKISEATGKLLQRAKNEIEVYEMENNFESLGGDSVFPMSRLVDFCGKESHIKILTQSRISEIGKSGHGTDPPPSALELRAEMWQEIATMKLMRDVFCRGLEPENPLLDAFGNLKMSNFGLSVLSQRARDDGATTNVWSYGVKFFVLVVEGLPFGDSCLLNLCKKIWNIELPKVYWDAMRKKDCKLDVTVYNVRVRYLHGGKPKEVRSLIVEMGEVGLKPGTISYNSLLTSYCTKGMISGLAHVADPATALELFDGLRLDVTGSNAEKFDVVVLVSLAAFQFIQGIYSVPKEVKLKGFEIDAEELVSIVEGHDHENYRQSLQFENSDRENRKITVQVIRDGCRQQILFSNRPAGVIVHHAIGIKFQLTDCSFLNFPCSSMTLV